MKKITIPTIGEDGENENYHMLQMSLQIIHLENCLVVPEMLNTTFG